MRRTLLAAGGMTAGGLLNPGCAVKAPEGMYGAGRKVALGSGKRLTTRREKSEVSFVTGTDTRDAAFRALKPLENAVARAVEGKRVVLKPNAGVIGPQHRHEVADVEQLRGILDFLKPLYDGQVIIAEGNASQTLSMTLGYKEYGYDALEREYNVRLVDANDGSTTTRWLLAGYLRPQPINLIDLYFEPDVYLISACRLKPSGGVLVTLSIKNIAMGSPVCHYKYNSNHMKPADAVASPKGLASLNEKSKMHGGLGSKPGRELSYNIFNVAAMGAIADLAVLDGVVAAEGNGPWAADPIEHGVALAGTDSVATDRIGAELMGVDYEYLPYMQWCAQAGLGRDNPDEITLHGPDYRPSHPAVPSEPERRSPESLDKGTEGKPGVMTCPLRPRTPA